MDSRKKLASFAFALVSMLVWAAVCQAGFAIRLEKEVPQSSVTSVNPIVASIFASQTAADPVATQTFRVSDLTLSMVESFGGAPVYRLRLDFTETDALTIAMDLYWEFSLGGTIIGKREKIPQSAASIFSVEAVTAGNADTVDGSHASDFAADAHSHGTGDIPGGAGSGLDADTVDGQHASAFAASGHGHGAEFYSQTEIDALLFAYQQVILRQQAVLRSNWLTLGGPELIETDNTANAAEPQVGVDSSGNAVAVWYQSDGVRNNIWANIYTAGTGWGTAQLIEADDTGSARNPQVAVDPSGNAIAVWRQSDGTRDNAWANTYTPGSGWGASVMIETGGGTVRGLSVSLDASGDAVVVWQQHNGAAYDIWANTYLSGAWGTAELIDNAAGSARNVNVALDPSGNAIAVWQQHNGLENDIWSNIYTAGTGWGTPEIIEGNAGTTLYSQVAVDSSGNAIAVWQQVNVVDSIWANVYTAGTGLWGTAELLETDDTGRAQYAQVAFDSSGNAVAVWQQGDGVLDNIWANKYTAGTGWGTAEMIESDNAGDALNPQVAVDPLGNAVAVWQHYDGLRDNIWANTYTVGTGWGTASMIETDNAGDAWFPQVAIDPLGNAVVVWQQGDGARDNIWANRF